MIICPWIVKQSWNSVKDKAFHHPVNIDLRVLINLRNSLFQRRTMLVMGRSTVMIRLSQLGLALDSGLLLLQNQSNSIDATTQA